MRPVSYGPAMPLGITNYWGADDLGDESLKSVGNRTVSERTNMAAIRQELTSTGESNGRNVLVGFCRGYLRPFACVMRMNWA
jgi:hypothetical protein